MSMKIVWILGACIATVLGMFVFGKVVESKNSDKDGERS